MCHKPEGFPSGLLQLILLNSSERGLTDNLHRFDPWSQRLLHGWNQIFFFLKKQTQTQSEICNQAK